MRKITLQYLFSAFLIHNTSISRIISDELYLKIIFKGYMGKKLNMVDPQSFNEKIQWLKLYNRNDSFVKMVDKFEAKQFAGNVIGMEHVIETIGIWEKFDDIDFEMLPNQFVLKCTHDSGGLVICRNKNELDLDKAKAKINKSLKSNFFYSAREWPYKKVKPRIIAERYLENDECDSEIEGLIDYKFFCFAGEPKLLYISKGLENHHTARISFYDLNGNEMPFHRSDYKTLGKIQLPENFDTMLSYAKQLADRVDSPFVRVDLYSIKGNIYFSEITFSPCGGFLPFEPVDWDEKLGEWIPILSKKEGRK